MTTGIMSATDGAAAYGAADASPAKLKAKPRSKPARKRDTAAELKETLAEYRIIFDNAIVGICFTRERVIVRCNRRFEEMFCAEPGELDNTLVRCLYPSEEAFLEIGRRAMEHLHKNNNYSDERVMRRKNGELFWCNVAGKVLSTRHPYRQAIWIFQDISKRKRAEEELQRAHERLEQRVQERTAELNEANRALRSEIVRRERTEEALRASREKYRVLFETFPIGISITDDAGNVIEINKTLGRISSRSMQAKLMRELRTPGAALIHADGSPVSREQLPSVQALEQQRVVANVELGVRYPNNKVRWFSVTAAPIAVKGYGVVVAHAEITERKQLEELDRRSRAELAHVSRLNTMGEMAAALAHELAQPLSATLNYLHGCQLRMESKNHDPELLRSAISQAISHAEQAGAIVKHMRQFVRRAEHEAVPTNLNTTLEEMVGFLDFERRQHGVQVELDLDAELPQVAVDPLEMKQVMLNLLKNGIEAMCEVAEGQRQLRVTSRRLNRRWLEMSFADRGVGIGKSDLAQIFNPFFTTKRNGLGLGLAICRSIIEAHGGRLTAARNVYGGASFSFTLPIGK
ncbi:MAG: Sensor protein TdiS [Nevskia sp.]|nr:Sensor protein TdiS [Nevskia sp.]